MKFVKEAATVFLLTVSLDLYAVEIKMKSLNYEPSQVEINQGDSVTWKNVAFTEHSAKSEDTPVVFDTGMIQPGKQSPPIHFDKPGKYKFHCALHGRTMTGVITVKAAAK